MTFQLKVDVNGPSFVGVGSLFALQRSDSVVGGGVSDEQQRLLGSSSSFANLPPLPAKSSSTLGGGGLLENTGSFSSWPPHVSNDGGRSSNGAHARRGVSIGYCNDRLFSRLVTGQLGNAPCVIRLFDVTSLLPPALPNDAVTAAARTSARNRMLKHLKDSGDGMLPCLASSQLQTAAGVEVLAAAYPVVPCGNAFDAYSDWVDAANPTPQERESALRGVLHAVLEQLARRHEQGRCHGSVKASNVFFPAALAPNLSGGNSAAMVLGPHAFSDVLLADESYGPLEQAARRSSDDQELAGSAQLELKHFRIREMAYVPPPECVNSKRQQNADSALPQQSLTIESNTTDAICRLEPSYDVWMFGLLAIHLADGGFYPWLKKQLKPLPALRRVWSPKFAWLVQMCVNTNPARRPTCAELLGHQWFQAPILQPIGTGSSDVFGVKPGSGSGVMQHAPEMSLLDALATPRDNNPSATGPAAANPSVATTTMGNTSSDAPSPSRLPWGAPTRHYLRTYSDILHEFQQRAAMHQQQQQQQTAPDESFGAADLLSRVSGGTTNFGLVHEQPSRSASPPVVAPKTTAAAVASPTRQRVADNAPAEPPADVFRPRPPFLGVAIAAMEAILQEVAAVRPQRLSPALSFDDLSHTLDAEAAVNRIVDLMHAFLVLHSKSNLVADAWCCSLLEAMRKRPEFAGYMEPLFQKPGTQHRSAISTAAEVGPPSVSSRAVSANGVLLAGGGDFTAAGSSAMHPTGAISSALPSQQDDHAPTPTTFNSYLHCKWHAISSFTLQGGGKIRWD